MKIHYLNCGTDCPIGGRIFDGFSKGPRQYGNELTIFCSHDAKELEALQTEHRD